MTAFAGWAAEAGPIIHLLHNHLAGSNDQSWIQSFVVHLSSLVAIRAVKMLLIFRVDPLRIKIKYTEKICPGESVVAWVTQD
jgi:hypothetical protein